MKFLRQLPLPVIAALAAATIFVLLTCTFHVIAADQSAPAATGTESLKATPPPLILTATPLPEGTAGSTDGIIALSIVLVGIILFGFFWGQRVWRSRI